MVTSTAKATTGHRYVVLCGKSLFAQGVAHLLKANLDMEVTLTNLEQGDPMNAIHSVSPDVLILDVSNLEGLGSFLARLLRECPAINIVGLDPQTSAIYLLRSRQRTVESTEEFLAMLQEEL